MPITPLITGNNNNAGGAANGQNSNWWREFNFSRKDRGESQRLRNLGNQVYQKNKLSEALDYYTQSICHAPHPPPPNSFLLHHANGGGSDEEGFSHEELALGFANRSAVLFQVRPRILAKADFFS